MLARRSDGPRRAVRRNEGANRRLGDPPGWLARGGDRGDPALFQGRWGWGRRNAPDHGSRRGALIVLVPGAVSAPDVHRTINAVWRIESPRLIAGLARIVRDLGRAEELAQDALVTALERWPESGIPDNPGAWLMATAKHRAIDELRRTKRAEQKHEEIGRQIDAKSQQGAPDLEAALDDNIGDDLLRLVFTACHPLLSTDARVALTLRVLGGLTTEEIARAFLVP